jgi:hypothetical protein
VVQDRAIRLSCVSGASDDDAQRPTFSGARGALNVLLAGVPTRIAPGQSVTRDNEVTTILADDLVGYGAASLRRIVIHRRARPGLALGGIDIGPGVVGESLTVYGGDQQDSARHPLCPYRDVFPAFVPTRLRYVNPAMAASPAQQTVVGGVAGVAAALAAAKAGNAGYPSIAAALSGISGSASAGCIIVLADGTYELSSTLQINNTRGTAENPLVFVAESPRGARIVGPAASRQAGRAVDIVGTSRHIHFHNIDIEGRGHTKVDPATFMVTRAGYIGASGGQGADGRAYAARIDPADVTVTGCRFIGNGTDDTVKFVETRGIRFCGNIVMQRDDVFVSGVRQVESVIDSVVGHDVILAFNDLRGAANNGIQTKGWGHRWVIAYNDVELFTHNSNDTGLIDLGGGGNASADIVLPLGNADIQGGFYGGHELYAIGNRCIQRNPSGLGVTAQGCWRAQVACNHIEIEPDPVASSNGAKALSVTWSGYGLRRDDGTRIMPVSALAIANSADRWTSYYDNIANHYPELVNHMVLMNRTGATGSVGGENQANATTISAEFTAVAAPSGHYLRSFGTDYSGNSGNAPQTRAAAWNARIYPRDVFMRDNSIVRKGAAPGTGFTPNYVNTLPTFALTDTGAGGRNRHVPNTPAAATTATRNTHAASMLPPVGRAGWDDQEVYRRLGLA